ncbi:TonB-dependent receptor [Nonlabens ulvanivorans]|nr:TonB-dependent receptor [Nonlabens ulvanivorans]
MSSVAQVVTVVDSDTNEPLVNVAVYNKSKSKSAVSDIEGQVDLKIFTDQEFIYFQSISYATIKIAKANISKDKFIRLQQQSDYFNPIILSASKFEQRAQDIPQKIFAVNREEITFNNPQTSADLLQQSGQVFVQKSQQGGGSPMIRGFSTNRLLITVDGVRMNTAIFRSGNLQNVISIDPLSVDRSEVILGPGSVVYGSDAIGGVMNFYTLKPQYQKDSIQITGSGLLRYASANNENTGHLDFNIGGEKWASATSITVNFFNDLRMGSHGPDDYLRESYVVRRDDQDISIVNDNSLIQRPTGYDQLNILQKFRYQLLKILNSD